MRCSLILLGPLNPAMGGFGEIGHRGLWAVIRRCGFGEIGHQEVYGRSSGGAVLVRSVTRRFMGGHQDVRFWSRSVIRRFMGGHQEVRFWSRSVIRRFMGGHQEVRFWSRSVKIGHQEVYGRVRYSSGGLL